MTKIRLNNAHRSLLSTYGQERIAGLIDRTEEKAFYAQLLDATNQAIRKRYPEEDMVVLRRYDAAQVDRCIRFQFPSGRVDGFYFSHEETGLADAPYCRSCKTDAAYPVDAATESALDGYQKTRATNDKERQKRISAFDSLICASKTLEEVMEAIDLPPDVLERLGRKTTALVALSTDDLKRLRTDFSLANAAAKAETESVKAAA